MTWHTRELKPGNLLIEDQDGMIVGSIVETGGLWRVELLRNDGPDVIFSANKYEDALGYVSLMETQWGEP